VYNVLRLIIHGQVVVKHDNILLQRLMNYIQVSAAKVTENHKIRLLLHQTSDKLVIKLLLATYLETSLSAKCYLSHYTAAA